MKIEINEDGFLLIERCGKIKHALCPFEPNNRCACGDWCDLFDEPENIDFKYTHADGKTDGIVWEIRLCHKTIRTTNFTDKRRFEK